MDWPASYLILIGPLRQGRRPAAKDEKYQEQDQTDDKQNLRHPGSGTGDTGKAKDGRNDRDNEKYHRPVKH
jgi:hypothetical protein